MDPEGSPRRKDWYETRELILSTFARMAIEDGVRDVSIQQVADRAGVAHRTVYRHFATRQDLVNHLAEWLHERGVQQGQVTTLSDISELPAALAVNARLFDQDADLMKALVRVTWESHTISDMQHRRTAEFETFFSPLTEHLDPTHARAVFALLRYLASSRTWLAFREEHGLTGEESGPVIAWVIQLLLDALRRGEVPDFAVSAREEARDDQRSTG